MSTDTTYFQSGFVSLDDLRPKAATKIAWSDVIAMRIRIRARRLAQVHAAKAAKEVGNG
jgi:hypothetical protein